ncbi:MAG: hypothetical protein GY856_24790 [bacterium]|nr:hypothetical protein [bacterium]
MGNYRSTAAAFGCALTLLLACRAPTPFPEGVMARWDGGELSREDLDDFALSLPPKQRQPAAGEDLRSWRERLLRRLVARRILIAEAEQALADEPALRFNLRMDEQRILAGFIATEAQLAAAPVTDEEIEDFYTRHRGRFSRRELLNVRHIYLRFHDGDGEAERQAKIDLMHQLRGRAAAGEDFWALAREYSESANADEGGLISFYGRGQSFPAFEEAAFALKEGEISPVFTSPRGVHLVQLETRYPARETSLDEVRDRLRTTLLNESREAKVRETEAELATSYAVEVDLEAVLEDPGDPQAPVVRVDDSILTVAEFRALNPRWRELAQPSRERLQQPFEELRRRMIFAREARGRELDQVADVAISLRTQRDKSLYEWSIRRKLDERRAQLGQTELEVFYNDHLSLFLSPRLVKTERIFLKSEPAELYATLLRAEELVRRIRSGESFAELARRHSDGPLAARGGQLPPLARRRLAAHGKEFLETVLGLEPGEVSDPVLCPHTVLTRGPAAALVGGMLIVRVREIEESHQLPLAETEDKARELYLRKNRGAVLQGFEEETLAGIELELNEPLLSEP